MGMHETPMETEAALRAWSGLAAPESEQLRVELLVESVIGELGHIKARMRACLYDLDSSERELRALREPRAERVLTAIQAARDATTPGTPASMVSAVSALLEVLTCTKGRAVS